MMIHGPDGCRLGQAQPCAAWGSTPQHVFDNAIVQLAAISPLAALAAFSPVAALAAVSPVLRLFNPALNARAALLAFDPRGINALAVAGGDLSPAITWPL